VENRIVTPAIRDILRTIGGAAERRVLDFVEKRDDLAKLLEEVIVIEAQKAGVTIQEVRLGEPAIPPELLVATLREQLADQLKQTYQKEQAAQAERIKVERDRATADQQKVLVKAEIEKQAAQHKKTRLQLEGEGEKLKLIEIARGQEAQVNVLGKDRTLQLQMLKDVLAVAKDNPDIIKIPTVQVNGTTAGFEGAAAILGASNLVQMLGKSTTTGKPEAK
jgi:regulator of protease activity HflC (stomatin/prohibitin superfamily)